jgi:hypothetical protein
MLIYRRHDSCYRRHDSCYRGDAPRLVLFSISPGGSSSISPRSISLPHASHCGELHNTYHTYIAYYILHFVLHITYTFHISYCMYISHYIHITSYILRMHIHLIYAAWLALRSLWRPRLSGKRLTAPRPI